MLTCFPRPSGELQLQGLLCPSSRRRGNKVQKQVFMGDASEGLAAAYGSESDGGPDTSLRDRV